MARLQIINTRFGYTCLDGTTISSVKSNDGILVSKGGDPLGTRISTPFSRQHFRRIGFTKVLSVAPFSVLLFPFSFLFFIVFMGTFNRLKHRSTNIIPSPDLKDYSVPIKPKNWFIVGIVDIFGIFLSKVTVLEKQNDKCSFSFTVRFRGTIPEKELRLLNKLKKFFKCGKVVIPKNKNHKP